MSSLPWYIARSAGLVGWAILTASVLWGLLMSTRFLGRRPRPAWVLDLHRYLGGLAVAFVVVHVVGVLLDTYVPFQLIGVLVPFLSHWRPVAVAWGVVGLYLLAAIEITSLLRGRLPRRLWRVTHYASFPLFVIATVHALSSGTDTGTWVFQAVAAVAITAVAALTAVRVGRRRRPAGAAAATAARPARQPATAAPAGSTVNSRRAAKPLHQNGGPPDGYGRDAAARTAARAARPSPDDRARPASLAQSASE